MDLPFDPLDYVDTFVFKDGDDVEISVEKMTSGGKWMVTRDRSVLTVDGFWIPIQDLDYANPIDWDLVGHDRDAALLAAYKRANAWRTS